MRTKLNTEVQILEDSIWLEKLKQDVKESISESISTWNVDWWSANSIYWWTTKLDWGLAN